MKLLTTLLLMLVAGCPLRPLEHSVKGKEKTPMFANRRKTEEHRQKEVDKTCKIAMKHWKREAKRREKILVATFRGSHNATTRVIPLNSALPSNPEAGSAV